MDPRNPTPPTTRVELSSALMDLTNGASGVVGRASRQTGPQIGTPAHMWVGGQNWSTGFSSIMQAISTAIDHSHAFATVLRAEESHGPSLAALCRAFVEVAGRAWWLLDSKDGHQLEHRAAVMRLREVIDMGEKGAPARVRDGQLETVTHAEVRRDAEDAVRQAAVAGHHEKTPNYKSLACRVMSAAEIVDPEGKYSHLSAVAHGHGFTVGGLGARSPHQAEGFTHFAISLPIANAQAYLRIMTRVLNVVAERFVSLSCDAAEHDCWRLTYVTSHNRIVTAFDDLSKQ